MNALAALDQAREAWEQAGRPGPSASQLVLIPFDGVLEEAGGPLGVRAAVAPVAAASPASSSASCPPSPPSADALDSSHTRKD